MPTRELFFIFREGWIDFARKKYGTAPEKWTPELRWLNRTRQESLTTSIVENRWRTYIYIYIVLLSSIFVKHALNSHVAARKVVRLPEKISCPTLGGAARSSHAYGYSNSSVRRASDHAAVNTEQRHSCLEMQQLDWVTSARWKKTIHRVKLRHRVYGHDTIAILWV